MGSISKFGRNRSIILLKKLFLGSLCKNQSKLHPPENDNQSRNYFFSHEHWLCRRCSTKIIILVCFIMMDLPFGVFVVTGRAYDANRQFKRTITEFVL